MSAKRVVIATAAVIGVALVSVYAYLRYNELPDDIATGPVASLIPPSVPRTELGSTLNTLPPAAVGAPGPAPGAEAPPGATAPRPGPEPAAVPDIGGTTVQGRIERVYVRVAEGVLIDLASAKPHQRDGMHYASIEFAEPLANGTILSRALMPDGKPELGMGDVVEMRFARKNVRGPYVQNFFPVAEKDRVTKLVARSGTALALDYEKRILARRGAGSGVSEAPNVALWNSLPLDRAIKIVHGNGKRSLAVFSDPYCPACQMFEQTLQGIDDVTLYVFMLPVIRPDRADISKSVWCSPDRAQAWLDLVLRQKLPGALPTCDNPVAANFSLLQSVGIRATPTVVFENGQRGQGNMLASAVRERLDQNRTDAQRAGEK
jgi:hypothetical protein